MNYSQPPSKMAIAEPKKPRRLSPRVLLLGVIALGAIGFVAYRMNIIDLGGTFQAGPGGPGAGRTGFGGGGFQGGAVPVRTAKVSTRDIPVMAHTIGTVLANATVSVKSQVDGQLLSAKFQEGDLVKEGDVLFLIDPLPLQAALRQAEATLARDNAQLASAQKDADRAAMLLERGIVSQQQADQTIAQAKALTATLAADQAAVDRAQLNVNYTTIRAPVTGKTGSYLVHPGNLVRGNTDALVVINQIQPVKISFFLPQNDLPELQDRMREGMLAATLQVHNDSGTQLPAQAESELGVRVDFIGNLVDEKTGTIELRASSDNPDLRLVPGELVDVIVQLDTMRGAIVVPREAVNIGQDGGTYVFLVGADRKVGMRPVKVQFQDEQIASIGNALAPGDTVVTDGQLRLIEGSTVSDVAAPAKQPAEPKVGGPGQGGQPALRGARAPGGAPANGTAP